MAYIIAEPCIGTKDTACVDACPVDCIHPKKDTQYEDGRPGFDAVEQLFIDPVECIDCGACVPVCPVTAIFALDDLPEKWHSYIEKNANYVTGGVPGRYAQGGVTRSKGICLEPFSLASEQWAAQALYEELYCARGDMENRIKEQFSLFADRVSSSPRAVSFG